MKVLLAGGNSYTGSRLLPVLLKGGHELVCLVRDREKFNAECAYSNQVETITGNLLKEDSIENFPKDIDAAYYLIHSLTDILEYAPLEALSAHNFVACLDKTGCMQLIYLAGSTNKNLTSRKQVEEILMGGNCLFTALHATVIIGQNSIFMEILQKIAGRRRFIAAPNFLKTRCQPIAIQDVLGYLEAMLMNDKAFNKIFEICGPEVLSYEEMLFLYAKKLNLNRYLVPIPVLSSLLTAYQLSTVTGLPFSVARNLGQSLLKENICSNGSIQEIAYRKCLNFDEAIAQTNSI
ncbi:MAG: NAD-dependent epimerase/dehydratase family protein [Sphingobacteriaceae bacterium]